MAEQDGADAARAEEPVFAAVLRPHRSLSPRQFGLLLAFIGGTCFASGLLFWSLGAWPIAGFFGLDLLAIQLAFRMNFRAAEAREIVEVTRERLTVTRVDARGAAHSIELNPYWARVEVERRPHFGVTAIALASHGRRLPIGGFLVPDEREGFVAALDRALAAVRAGRG
ncbi:DUF2244 domain-containing protein [Prosthecomicrobium pneumaticum]|uniref:Putative membrane protein n=1 Tax=Prosthecomicrobium pneumaticum TaxID=81895 RepID=A0A7W9L2Z3_9HYPH|nr:DUF2244 domain-containing protein [Prosthecomicrobium pneumaticum]MBB5753984.1 putative membrane protein [Prosthecomicrobium pneumaticum]